MGDRPDPLARFRELFPGMVPAAQPSAVNAPPQASLGSVPTLQGAPSGQARPRQAPSSNAAAPRAAPQAQQRPPRAAAPPAPGQASNAAAQYAQLAEYARAAAAGSAAALQVLSANAAAYRAALSAHQARSAAAGPAAAGPAASTQGPSDAAAALRAALQGQEALRRDLASMNGARVLLPPPPPQQRHRSRNAPQRRGDAPEAPQEQPEGAEDAEEAHPGAEEDHAAEDKHTFSAYVTKPVTRLYAGSGVPIRSHPDRLVESASLASVQLPQLRPEHLAPLRVLDEDLREGRLSDAQLEAIVYAIRNFNGPRLPDGTRRGFFLGDGAGVGKGRTIAGLVKQHWASGGRYILWLSVSQDLRLDATRDLRDLEVNDIPVFKPVSKEHVPKSDFRGVVFITYSLLISGLPKPPKKRPREESDAGNPDDREAVHAGEGAYGGGGGGGGGGKDGYEAGVAGVHGAVQEEEPRTLNDYLIDGLTPKSRLAEVIAWLSRGRRDGALIIFDESHRAKNFLETNGAKATQTGRAVVHLQAAMPDAKVVYASATGASEPRNMAYMMRLWGAEATDETVRLLSEANLGSIELAALSLKTSGKYVARALSYEGADFDLARVEIDRRMQIMYDRSTLFWGLLFNALKVVGRKRWRMQFWSAHQRFYRSFLMAVKTAACARLAAAAVAEGKSVVIGLQSTGEAGTERAISQAARAAGDDLELDDLVSAPLQIVDHFIRTQFPRIYSEDDDEAPSTEALRSTAYQVWRAHDRWRNAMVPVAQLVPAVPAASVVASSGVPPPLAGALDAETEAALAGADLDAEMELTEEEERRLDEEIESASAAGPGQGPEGAGAMRRPLADVSLAAEARVAAARAAAEDADRAVVEAKRAKERAAAALAAAEARAAAPRPADDGIIDLTGESDDEAAAAAAAAPRSAQEVRRQAAPLVPAIGHVCAHPGCPVGLLVPDEMAFAECSICAARWHAGCLNEPAYDAMQAWPGWFTCDTCLITGPPAGAATPPTGSGPAAADAIMRDADGDVEMGQGEAGTPEQLREALQRAERVLENVKKAAKECQRRLRAAERERDDAVEAAAMGAGAGASPLVANPAGRQRQRQAGTARRSRAGRAAESQRAAAATAAQPSAAAAAAAPRAAPMTYAMAVAAGAGAAGARVAGTAPAAAPPLAAAGPVPQPAYRRVSIAAADAGGRIAVAHPDPALGEAVPDNRAHAREAILQQGALSCIQRWLLAIVTSSLELPPNPLDDLIDRLGGPQYVAEMTGRAGGVSIDPVTGRAVYRQRKGAGADCAAREVNLREKKAFMDGCKHVAIISDAASTGISLQADKRVPSHIRRRVHLTLELPWSADKAIQQFGRSHRANQASAPHYQILVTPCGGEHRFASAAAKRLQSLGALLRGDRNAVGAGSELREFDVDTPAGAEAVRTMLRCCAGMEAPLLGVTVPELPMAINPAAVAAAAAEEEDAVQEGEDGEGGGMATYVPPANARHAHLVKPFFRHFRRRLLDFELLQSPSHTSVDQETLIVPPSVKVATLLNRLLGLPIAEQDLLFSFFSTTLEAVIRRRRSSGRHDVGIVALKGRSVSIASRVPILRDADNGDVERVDLVVDCGTSFEEAVIALEEGKKRITELAGADTISGFYIQRFRNKYLVRGAQRPYIALATLVADGSLAAGSRDESRVRVVWPTGTDSAGVYALGMFMGGGGNGRECLSYARITDMAQVKQLWDAWFEHAATGCRHGERCSYGRFGNVCRLGCRMQKHHLICGAVLPHWRRLEALHKAAAERDIVPKNHRRIENDNTYWEAAPLLVRRAICAAAPAPAADPNAAGPSTSNQPAAADPHEGEPVVGIRAENEVEMVFFQENMQNARTINDPVLEAFGSNYYSSTAVRGLSSTRGGSAARQRRRRGGGPRPGAPRAAPNDGL